jgi:hypothetical protein
VLQRFPCSLQITLSADHYLLVARHKGAAFSQRSAVPAADVTPGMLLWRRTESGSMAVEAVTSVRPVSASGLVNPFTLRGAAPLLIDCFAWTAHAVQCRIIWSPGRPTDTCLLGSRLQIAKAHQHGIPWHRGAHAVDQ